MGYSGRHRETVGESRRLWDTERDSLRKRETYGERQGEGDRVRQRET